MRFHRVRCNDAVIVDTALQCFPQICVMSFRRRDNRCIREYDLIFDDVVGYPTVLRRQEAEPTTQNEPTLSCQTCVFLLYCSWYEAHPPTPTSPILPPTTVTPVPSSFPMTSFQSFPGPTLTVPLVASYRTSLSSLVEMRGPPSILENPWLGLCPPDLIAKVSLLSLRIRTIAATSCAVVGYS